MPAKGKLKRRRAGTQFQKGVTSLPAPKDVTGKDAHSVKDAKPHQPPEETQGPDLRSRRHLKKKPDENNISGNRIIDLKCLISTMNTVLQDHQKLAANCEATNFYIESERKVGLGSDLRFACKSCQFVSQICRTYRPRKGKSKGAAVNMMLATGLLDTSIGVEKANILLVHMNIAPPSRSHLQNLFSEASKNIIALNEKDMADKRQQVIQHNQTCGSADPRQLDLSFDVRYNANRMTSSYKPGQAASQAYGVAVENHTGYKYVVGLAIQNKLCWTGAYLKNKGYDIECQGGHEGCTSNKDPSEPHSEREMANDIASQMYDEEIMIRTLTTDGDTKSYLGMQDFYNKLGAIWTVTRQADPNHLGASQMRRVHKAKWSEGMFPSKRTVAEKKRATTALARDVKAWCSTIIQKLRGLGKGDITKQIRILPEVCQATVECYAGNCSFCPHQSLVCSGVGGPGDWWFDSKFLPTRNIHRLKMTDNDKSLLRTILEIRLSEAAVYSVSSNTSTQKCEAFNSGVSSVLSKNTNYPRNFGGKLASETMNINNPLDQSVKRKHATVTSEALSPRALRYLERCSRRNEQRKKYQKSPAAKSKRRAERGHMEFRHEEALAGSAYKDKEREHIEGQLDYA